MSVFVTADLHLGHAFVAKIRGFDTVDEHDATIERNWANFVRNRDDEVFVLGDVALGGWRDGFARLATWPGKKHLILGNHDRAHPGMSRAFNYHRESLAAFESIQTAAELRSKKGVRVLLSHFPYEGDHTEEDRYDQWRLRDLGVPLVHGHTHSREKLTKSKAGTTQIHVGLDSWNLNPVPVETVYHLAGSAR